MKAPTKIVRSTLGPAEQFKREIEKAQQDGVSTGALLLKLTRGDGAKLKRDRNIPTDSISFAGGEMRYLGVKVIEGETADSALVMLQG